MILMPSLALPSLDVFVSGFRLGKRISLSPISAAATGAERTTNVVMLRVNRLFVFVGSHTYYNRLVILAGLSVTMASFNKATRHPSIHSLEGPCHTVVDESLETLDENFIILDFAALKGHDETYIIEALCLCLGHDLSSFPTYTDSIVNLAGLFVLFPCLALFLSIWPAIAVKRSTP